MSHIGCMSGEAQSLCLCRFKASAETNPTWVVVVGTAPTEWGYEEHIQHFIGLNTPRGCGARPLLSRRTL